MVIYPLAVIAHVATEVFIPRTPRVCQQHAGRVGVLFPPAAVWSKCGSEVDFDELAGESEPGHAQERARSGERRSDDRKGELAPGRGFLRT